MTHLGAYRSLYLGDTVGFGLDRITAGPSVSASPCSTTSPRESVEDSTLTGVFLFTLWKFRSESTEKRYRFSTVWNALHLYPFPAGCISCLDFRNGAFRNGSYIQCQQSFRTWLTPGIRVPSLLQECCKGMRLHRTTPEDTLLL